MYKHFFKRLLSFCIALTALLCIFWFLAIVAIFLHFVNKGAGAFFYQKRIGMGEKPFCIIKFKSMTDERDENGILLPDAKRLTKMGKFVRSTSIDELPQLINILKGDMGFIGPRPLPPVYLPYYTPEESHRHDIRPGISGWAQVSGRKNITWAHKLECDIFYVNNCTFAMDVKIFFLTIENVLKREGVEVETSGNVSLFDTRGIQRAELIQYDPNFANRSTNTHIK